MVKKINWLKKVSRNGSDVTVIIKDGMGFMNFISNYERWLDEILEKIIEKDDACFLDVGANTGQTLIKVFSKFPNVRYFAVEPNENCVKYLHALANVNNFKSLKILPYALSDADGEAELLTRYQDDILATTTQSFRKFTKYSSKTKVKQTTGDALLKQGGDHEVSVIKMDIEGGEAKALAGLYETIKKYQPYILCEIAPLPTEDKAVTAFRIEAASKILSLLKELDYSIINIITKQLINNTEDLSTSLESCNYVFVPKSKPLIRFLD